MSISAYPYCKFSALTINNAVPLKYTRRRIVCSAEKSNSPPKYLSVSTCKSWVSGMVKKKSLSLNSRPSPSSFQDKKQSNSKIRKIVRPFIIKSPKMKNEENFERIAHSHEQTVISIKECLTKKPISTKIQMLPKGLQRFFTSKLNTPDKKQRQISEPKKKIKFINNNLKNTMKYKDIPIQQFLASDSEGEDVEEKSITKYPSKDINWKLKYNQKQKVRNKNILHTDDPWQATRNEEETEDICAFQTLKNWN